MAKINRSAESGKLVTKQLAKERSGTTVTENVKNNKSLSGKIQNSMNIINNHLALIEGWVAKL